MVIPINIEPSQIIKTYLLCLNPIMKLKRRELEVLEAIIKAYISLKKNSSMTEKEIDSRINDAVGRKVIRDLIKMSDKSFINHYSQLKKKKIITQDNKLQPFLKEIDKEIVDMTLNINYTIKVKINETGKN